MNESGDAPTTGGRGRLLIVGATAVLLGALIALVLALSGDEERGFTAAPASCVSDWNGDAAALALGRHQFAVHRYQQLEVLYLTPDGLAVEAPEGESGTTCAVVFAAAAADAEASSTVQILRPIGWAPLSGAGTPVERLAELQTEAQESYNALLSPDGSVEPL